MTQIAATDDAIIRLLEGCAFPGVSILSCPHEWDGGYITRLLAVTPAVLVAFLGGDDATESTSLSLAGKWGVYVCTGWNGQDQTSRRKGAGAGFDLAHRVRGCDSQRDPHRAERRTASHNPRRGNASAVRFVNRPRKSVDHRDCRRRGIAA